MRVPWTARRSNQSILKKVIPDYSLLEGLTLKLKLQYFGHLMRRVDSLERTLMLGGIGGIGLFISHYQIKNHAKKIAKMLCRERSRLFALFLFSFPDGWCSWNNVVLQGVMSLTSLLIFTALESKGQLTRCGHFGENKVSEKKAEC